MSLGLYSGSPGLSVGIGLYQGSLGLFSGSPGLISGGAPSGSAGEPVGLLLILAKAA